MLDTRHIFESDLASACRQKIEYRISQLDSQGFTADPEGGADHSSELDIYTRIAGFQFDRHPNYTAPWHLLTWPHMRWDHVYHVISILESLNQPTGSNIGQPIKLEPFQAMILLAFLGPENPDTGFRLVNEGLLTLARKNAKTTLTAGLATSLMVLDPASHGLRGQEIQVGASDREQAGITHTMAERFTSMDEDMGLKDKFHSIPSKKLLTHRLTLTALKCLSSDAYRAHGGNPCMVLMDEIGNVPATAAEDFYSVLTSGFGAQDEPLTLLLSTQAPNDEHFFSQQVDRAKRVNEGMLQDNEFAGFVFSVPEEDLEGNEIDAFDESLWYLGNPGIDTIMRRADIRTWAKKARELPSLQNKFENLRLNRRVSETSSFVTRRMWQKNTGTLPEMTDLFGCSCYLGLDLSETTDLTALVAIFEPLPDGRMPVYPFFWIPGNDIRGRVERDKVPYDQWEREGLIDTSSNHTVDYHTVALKIIQLLEDYDVQAFSFDRWKIKYVQKELQAEGYEWDDEEEFLIPIGQGFKDQTRSIEVLEELLLKEKIAHGGHKILKWNAANAVIVHDPSKNRKFEKNKSYGRIDGIVALAVAAHARDMRSFEEYGGDLSANENVAVFM